MHAYLIVRVGIMGTGDECRDQYHNYRNRMEASPAGQSSVCTGQKIPKHKHSFPEVISNKFTI